MGQYGHSKDSRPDLKQMIVGAILDGAGRPICCGLWPGNVTDITRSFPSLSNGLSPDSAGIASACVVADHGMISCTTIESLENKTLKMDYILGVRMRKVKGDATSFS
jgi:transposase